uniref:Uncharacterized protein n=1 Tax=Romanomermis culicivorax TaxID=13658 RepID=A0A915HHS3_ROMCU
MQIFISRFDVFLFNSDRPMPDEIFVTVDRKIRMIVNNFVAAKDLQYCWMINRNLTTNDR